MPWTQTFRALGLALLASAAAPAEGQVPDADVFLADSGFSPAQIAQVQAGNIVQASIQPSNEREIVASLAFLVKVPPADLVNELRRGLLSSVDPNVITSAAIDGPPSPASFAKLSLDPGAEARAKGYAAAKPGGDLNLSASELAGFGALGAAPAVPAVEAVVKSALLARLQAYQARGLAGIEPYARSGGRTRSPGDDLRSATQAASRLQAVVPGTHRALLAYPASKPPGLDEGFLWSNIRANGVPTFVLTHTLFIPEGPNWVAVQRQFYVSGGYNCEQAIAGFLPMQEGTLVYYANRTSTDQVSGMGGGARRAIGSRLLRSQLEALFAKVQATQKK
jgi:hypothetical protein